jgi:hypothetical protein
MGHNMNLKFHAVKPNAPFVLFITKASNLYNQGIKKGQKAPNHFLSLDDLFQ